MLGKDEQADQSSYVIRNEQADQSVLNFSCTLSETKQLTNLQI